jgi:heat shock protein HtpX
MKSSNSEISLYVDTLIVETLLTDIHLSKTAQASLGADLIGKVKDYFSAHVDSNNKAGLILVVFAILLAILAPFFAQIIKLAISRNREYLADASAAQLTRYPEGLASALEKISKDKEPLKTANKATAHLYIANPLKGHESFLNNLFSTHPPIAQRILLLRKM